MLLIKTEHILHENIKATREQYPRISLPFIKLLLFVKETSVS